MQAFLLELPNLTQGSATLGCGVLALTAFVGAMLFVPRALFCVVGGFLFGWIALPIVLIAGTAGAAVGCFPARPPLPPPPLRLGRAGRGGKRCSRPSTRRAGAWSACCALPD